MSEAVSENGGRRPRLTRERVIQAALAVADSGGLGSLTIRSLAKELGAKPMSVYYHVANKAKLDRIDYVSSHFPMRCFAFDQFGPLSIRPCHGSAWAPESKPVRLAATYHRTHGIRYFHGCSRPGR